MRKTYLVKVGTRNRITVPMNCWMDAGKPGKLEIETDKYTYHFTWNTNVGMTKNLSYRITVPYKEGTKLELIPDYSRRLIKVKQLC